MSISTPTASTSAGPFSGLRVNVRDFGTVVGLLLILAVFALIAPGFLSERNLMNVLLQSSINACVALGMTLVIISGGTDLSVGPTAALSAVLSAALMVAGVPPAIAVVAGLALGAVCGLVNGALVAFGGLQPFIVTFGTLSTYRALALIFTGGNPILGVPAGFRAVANGYLFGIPASVIVVIVVALIAFILLRKTPFANICSEWVVTKRRLTLPACRSRSPRLALMFCPVCWPRWPR